MALSTLPYAPRLDTPSGSSACAFLRALAGAPATPGRPHGSQQLKGVLHAPLLLAPCCYAWTWGVAQSTCIARAPAAAARDCTDCRHHAFVPTRRHGTPHRGRPVRPPGSLHPCKELTVQVLLSTPAPSPPAAHSWWQPLVKHPAAFRPAPAMPCPRSHLRRTYAPSPHPTTSPTPRGPLPSPPQRLCSLPPDCSSTGSQSPPPPCFYRSQYRPPNPARPRLPAPKAPRPPQKAPRSRTPPPPAATPWPCATPQRNPPPSQHVRRQTPRPRPHRPRLRLAPPRGVSSLRHVCLSLQAQSRALDKKRQL